MRVRLRSISTHRLRSTCTTHPALMTRGTGVLPGGRLRTERLLRLIETGRVDPGLLLTHKFYGFSHVEQALYLMKDKTPDLIKPVVSLA